MKLLKERKKFQDKRLSMAQTVLHWLYFTWSKSICLKDIWSIDIWPTYNWSTDIWPTETWLKGILPI
jgi:hypothetical protein